MSEHARWARDWAKETSPSDPHGAGILHALLAIHDLLAERLPEPSSTEAERDALRAEVEALRDEVEAHARLLNDEPLWERTGDPEPV